MKNMDVLTLVTFSEVSLSIKPFVLLVYVPKFIAGSEKRKNGEN